MAPHDSPLAAVLDEIERILEEERDGLRRLDREVVDRCAVRKTSLESTLRTVLTHAKPGELQRARMERLKAAALVNQMLIAQARSCLRSILQVASGQSGSDPPPSIAATAARAEAPERRILVQG
jgi:anti-sigma factor ChrR (cupin superfamily)